MGDSPLIAIRDAIVTRMGQITTTGGAYPFTPGSVVKNRDVARVATDKYPRITVRIPDGEAQTNLALTSGYNRSEIPVQITVERYVPSTGDRQKYLIECRQAVLKAIYTDDTWGGKSTNGTELRAVTFSDYVDADTAGGGYVTCTVDVSVGYEWHHGTP